MEVQSIRSKYDPSSQRRSLVKFSKLAQILKLLLFLPFLFCLNVTSQPQPVVSGQVDDPLKSYEDCTINKIRGCIGVSKDVAEKDCISSQTCYILVTYRTSNHTTTATERRVHFQIFSSSFTVDASDRYIAIGISEDGNMGDDIVVACINYSGNLHIQLSYNDGYGNFIETLIPLKPSQLVKESITVINGEIRCSFSLPTALRVSNLYQNLETTPYNLLLAHGHSMTLDTLYQHIYRYSFSDQKVNFASVEVHRGTAENQDNIHLAITLHAFFMTFTFITLIPTATMIGRFSKESHVTFTFANRRYWFVLHVFFMTIGFVGMVIGEAIMIYAFGLLKKLKVIPFRNHYVIGIVLTVAYVCQMILGAFLNVYYIDSYSLGREIAARIHFATGVVIYLAGLVQLFLVPYYLPSFLRFCSTGSILVPLWLLIHSGFFGIASTIMWRSDTVEFKSLQHAERLSRQDIGNDDAAIDPNSKAIREHKTTKPGRDIHVRIIDPSQIISYEKVAPHQLQSLTIKKGSKQSQSESDQSRRPSSVSQKSAKSGSILSATRPAPVQRKSKVRPTYVSKLSKPKADVEVTDMTLKKKSTGSPKLSQVRERKSEKEFISTKPEIHDVRRSLKTSATASSELVPTTKNPLSRDRSNHSRELHSSRENTSSPNAAVKRRKSPQKSATNPNPEGPSGKQLELEPLQNIKRSSDVPSGVDSIGADSDADIDPEPNSVSLENAEKSMTGHRGHHRRVIEIVPQRNQVIYDDFPEYDTKTVGMEVIQSFRKVTKVQSKQMKKDPLRAFKSFPMKVYFTREYPKTAKYDLVLAIFFVISLCMSAGIVYSMTPYGNMGNCNANTWMVNYP